MLQKYFQESKALTAADGTKLNVGIWRASAPVASLFYIHGLQSHSGWLFETGPYLASHGVNVIAMDRRGSGKSEGTRGHAQTSDHILEDYHQALGFACRMSGELPMAAMGQSFGGSILAALACRHDLRGASLIFSAPALGQQRLRLDPYELNLRRARKGKDVYPIRLRDQDYTSDEKYLRFIANDALIVRTVTGAMRSSMIELEDIYHDNQYCLERLKRPVNFIEPQYDPIIDVKVSRHVLNQHTEVTRHVIETHSHYMEFTSKRYELWDKLIQICTNRQEQYA